MGDAFDPAPRCFSQPRYQRVSASAFIRVGHSLARTISVAALVGGLAIQSAAHAIPIGDFSWSEPGDECEIFCGALFSVGNLSDQDLSLGLLGGSFFDVLVDLQTDVGLMSLSLGAEIAAGGSGQSFDDLSGLAILSAGLRLTFAVPTLPGSVRLLDMDGNVVTGLTAPGLLLIDYAIDEVVTPVPEPSTLLMLAGGLIGIAVGRRARQRTATPEKSRMKPSSRHALPT